MKTFAVVFHGDANEFADRSLASGKGAFARTLDFLRSFGDLEGALILAGPTPLSDSPYPAVSRETWTMRDVLDAARVELESRPEVDALLYLWGDCPLLDAGLARRMLADFRSYRAEYHFADGLPPGLAIEFLRPRILPSLVALCRDDALPVTRDGVFTVVQRDINSFDIETEISRVDLREFRLSLTCGTKRDFETVERLMALGVGDAESAQNLIPAHGELLRTFPAFLQVQVAGACPQACSYCPYPGFHERTGDAGALLDRKDFMSVERFARLMDEAAVLSDDIVVDLSLWGEASLHPDFPGLVDAALGHPRFRMIVETSGIGWKPATLEALAAAHPERLNWIVSLDDPDPAGYASLRGDGRSEAEACALRLVSLFPAMAYVQAVRMKENEERLEGFYRVWKKRTDNVIIQKYDAFAGLLPDRSVADLSPLSRPPCRHLARDLSVLLDGTVPLCRECLAPGAVGDAVFLGNAFESGLETVWKAGEPWFLRHVGADYPVICGRCDEYHTYNA
ncbi:MAG: spiro-SPASM protein [Spirochaetes bacterium]|nr:spiro-SPASM protein [Spirochaetota bacterium]